MNSTTVDCLIVGAGISGLLAAETLRENGKSVLILEKSRGPGGRMATRRIGEAKFDHGAQFFTVRREPFKKHVEDWVSQNIVKVWTHGFPRGADDTQLRANGHARYNCPEGMTAIAKHLAKNHEVKTQIKVASISEDKKGVELLTEDGTLYKAKSAILTAPVPQSLEILENGKVEIEQNTLHQLTEIEYDPCFALMLLLDGSPKMISPGALQLHGEPFHFIADNHIKGVSALPGSLTVHLGQKTTRKHYDNDHLTLMNSMLPLLKPFLNGNRMTDFSVQRWRYSQPQKNYPERSCLVGNNARIALAGDAFGEAKVEGAALSGMDAANRIIEILGN